MTAQETAKETPNETGSRPRTAMVLAAGLGKRMRPLTDHMPKPMVPLAGRPLIDHVLQRLADAGISRAVVNLHYLPDVLQNHLAAHRELEIILSDERGEVLDTGGGVAKALPSLGAEPFLVHNSDSVWMEADECDGNGDTTATSARAAQTATTGRNLDRLIGAWDPGRMDCLLMLASCKTSLGYDGQGDFDLLADGRLRRRTAGEETPYVFAGVSIMDPELFATAPPSRFSLNLLWNKAIEAGRLYGICATGIWMHVGDPAALKLAEQQFAERRA